MSDINADEWYIEFRIGTSVMLPHGSDIEAYIDHNFEDLFKEAAEDGAQDGVYIIGLNDSAKGEWWY